MRPEDSKSRRTPARKRLDRAVGGVLAAILAALVLDVLWQIVSRFVLGAPSAWTEELARYLLVWLGLLGAAYAYGQRRHLAVDILARRLAVGGARRLAVIAELAVALFAFVVLTIGGGALVKLVSDLGQRTAALGLPLGWIYSALPISGLLTLAYGLLAAIEADGRAGRGTDGNAA